MSDASSYYKVGLLAPQNQFENLSRIIESGPISHIR